MDIISHGAWAAIGATGANRKLKAKINWKEATFWGIFPDLFAFAPLIVSILFKAILNGGVSLPGTADFNSNNANLQPIHTLTNYLYSTSHSLVIFGAFFLLWRLWRRNWHLAFLGWLLHILIDIPTHSLSFYPTPFLWPFSNWHVNGLAWANPKFLAVNYTALIVVGLVMWRWRVKAAAKGG